MTAHGPSLPNDECPLSKAFRTCTSVVKQRCWVQVNVRSMYKSCDCLT